MSNDNKEIRVRFAPSPTGKLHIGGVRTALFNYLFAKKHQGKFILRIEDTDKERSKPEFEKDILESLKWLGINFDEKFYRQSERLEIYKKYIKKLLDEEKAYYCFCPKEELEAHRQYMMSIGEPPRYSGKCRNLSDQEVRKNLKEKKPSVIRFKVPSKKIIFNDLVRGRLEFDSNLIGDIVIAKDTSSPLYNLAVVIDDFEMKISHIIRGEEHISNTPKQILLQEALGFPKLKYAHLPLILGPDRTKLSKRQGAVSILEYKKNGYLPEALINFIALLGWNPKTDREIFSIASLIKEFSLEGIQKPAAIANIKRLDWFNSFYIRQKSIGQLTMMCIPYLIEANLIQPIKNQNSENFNNNKELKLFKEKQLKFKIKETEEIINEDYLRKIVSIYQERLKKLSEIPELTGFFFKKELNYNKQLLSWKDMPDKQIKVILDKLEKILSDKITAENFDKENLEKILIPEAERTSSELLNNQSRDRGYLLWPLRVALTGKQSSAPPFEIAEILGKEKTLERIKQAKKIIKI